MRIVALVGIGAALAPSVIPFTVFTSEGDRVCVAAAHGWHKDRPRPTDADLRQYARTRQRHIARVRAAASTPGYKRVESYIDWLTGPGACVQDSRHRLIQSGSGVMTLLMLALAVTALELRRRRSAFLPDL